MTHLYHLCFLSLFGRENKPGLKFVSGSNRFVFLIKKIERGICFDGNDDLKPRRSKGNIMSLFSWHLHCLSVSEPFLRKMQGTLWFKRKKKVSELYVHLIMFIVIHLKMREWDEWVSERRWCSRPSSPPSHSHLHSFIFPVPDKFLWYCFCWKSSWE